MELKIINKKPLLLQEVGENIEKKDIPLQQKVFDSMKKFSKFNKDKALKILEELNSLEIPRLEDEQFIQIINLAPKTESELKSVFSGSKTTVSSENIKKILETLKKHEK